MKDRDFLLFISAWLSTAGWIIATALPALEVTPQPCRITFTIIALEVAWVVVNLLNNLK
jgi:hypothetical protein